MEIQFEQFKNLVLENKKQEIKVFFEFPINGVDLWYKVLSDSDIQKANTEKPISEVDFNNYFDKIFSRNFKDCLEGLNTHQLFDSGQFSTKFIAFNQGDLVGKSQMVAVYLDNELTLTIHIILQHNSDEGDSEHTEIFTFKNINQRLRFTSFNMAG